MVYSLPIRILSDALESIKNKPDTVIYEIDNNDGGFKKFKIKWVEYGYTWEIYDNNVFEEESIKPEPKESFLDESKFDYVLFIKKNNQILYSYRNKELDFFHKYQPGDICGICHDNLSNGSSVCVNAICQHGFHCECIENWFEHSQVEKCPVCKEMWQSVPLNQNQETVLRNTGFGKGLKSICSDINFLKKIK